MGLRIEEFPNPDLSRALETAATRVTDHATAIQIFDMLFRHGLSIHNMKGHCRRSYSCSCKEEEQLKVVQYLLDQGADPLPKNSSWRQSVLKQAVNRKYKMLHHTLLQTIIDTPGDLT